MPAVVAGFIATPSAVNAAWIASPRASQKSQRPAARGRDPRRTRLRGTVGPASVCGLARREGDPRQGEAQVHVRGDDEGGGDGPDEAERRDRPVRRGVLAGDLPEQEDRPDDEEPDPEGEGDAGSGRTPRRPGGRGRPPRRRFAAAPDGAGPRGERGWPPSSGGGRGGRRGRGRPRPRRRRCRISRGKAPEEAEESPGIPAPEKALAEGALVDRGEERPEGDPRRERTRGAGRARGRRRVGDR